MLTWDMVTAYLIVPGYEQLLSTLNTPVQILRLFFSSVINFIFIMIFAAVFVIQIITKIA